jgi:hypothetical protein
MQADSSSGVPWGTQAKASEIAGDASLTTHV